MKHALVLGVVCGLLGTMLIKAGDKNAAQVVCKRVAIVTLDGRAPESSPRGAQGQTSTEQKIQSLLASGKHDEVDSIHQNALAACAAHHRKISNKLKSLRNRALLKRTRGVESPTNKVEQEELVARLNVLQSLKDLQSQGKRYVLVYVQ